MHRTYVPRKIEPELTERLRSFAAVAVLGPRRSGKTTLAKAMIAHKKQSVYLDLERPSDLEKLTDPELFLDLHRNDLIVLSQNEWVNNISSPLRGGGSGWG